MPRRRRARSLRQFRPLAFETCEPRLVLTGNPVDLNLSATLATPQWPKGVVAADFNADGIPDLATANDAGNNVSIFRGNGDGTFAGANSRTVGGQPVTLSTGDFNEDGRPDAAVALFGGNAVAVLLTASDGTFAPPANYAVGASPTYVAAADFNGDGHLDLASSNYNSGTISLWFGSGTGTFAGRSDIGAALGIHFLRTADLNGDGDVDVVSVNSIQDVMRVNLGNGDGTFQAGVNYPTGASYPHKLTIADFDRDGKQDIVAAHHFGEGLTYFRGNGDGTFAAAGFTPAGIQVHDVLHGDLNADGILDLIIAADAPDNLVGVFTGNGDGTFEPRQSVAAQTDTAYVALADLNGNGTLDVAATNETSNTLQAWLNLATPSNPHLSISVASNAPPGLPGAVTVTALDSANNILTGFTGTVHFASSDPLATLPADYTFQPGDYGTKTFGVTLRTLGSQTISATLVGSNGIFAGALANSLQPAAWYRAEGTTNDSVGSNNGLFQAGNSFAAGRLGQAFNFSGSNAVNIAKTNSVLNPGSSNFTLESWIQVPNQVAGSTKVILHNYGGTQQFGMYLSQQNFLQFDARDASNNYVLVTGQTALNDNQWHHVAGVRNGSSFSIYVDGQLAGTQTNTVIGSINPPTTFVRIGGTYTNVNPGTTPTSSESFFTGKIDELAYHQRPLTLTEIQSRVAVVNTAPVASAGGPYTASPGNLVTVTASGSLDAEEPAANLSYAWDLDNDGAYDDATGTNPSFYPVWITSPGTVAIGVKVTDANGLVDTASTTLTVTAVDPKLTPIARSLLPAAHYRAEGTANDGIGSNNGSFQTGSPLTNFVAGHLGQAFNFNGSNAVNIAKNNSVLSPGSGNFTIEGWIQAPLSLPTGPTKVIVHNYGGVQQFGLYLDHLNRLRFDARDANSNYPAVTSTVALNDNQWHHVAGVRQGSLFSIYIDGQLAGSLTNTAIGSVNPPTSYVRIGGTYTNLNPETTPTSSESFFTGNIDELAYYQRALTSIEIETLAGAVNHPPAASAAGPYPVNLGSYVTLDASSSFDSEEPAANLRYEWDLNEDGIYDDATGMRPMYVPKWLAGSRTLSIAVKVTDASGASDISVTTLDILPADPTKPATVATSADTFITDAAGLGGPNSTHGGDPSLWSINFFTPGAGGSLATRPMFQFDLRAYEGATITGDATFRAYLSGPSNNPDYWHSQSRSVDLYRITSPWDAATVTWNTGPTVALVQSQFVLLDGPGTNNRYIDWTVPQSIVQNWINCPPEKVSTDCTSKNYGLMIVNELPDAFFYDLVFASREHPVDKPALLEFEAADVTPINEPPTATLSAPSPVTYGEDVVVALTGASDSLDDIAAGFHYAFGYSSDNVSPLTDASYANSGSDSEAPFPMLDAGTYYVFARIIDQHDGFTEYSRQVTIERASSTTTMTCDAGPFTFNGEAQEPCSAVVTGAGGLSLPLTVNYLDNVNAGTATAGASFAGDANHTASDVSTTFDIGKATAEVSVSGYSDAYDGLAHGAIGSFTGVGPDVGAAGASLDVGASFINVPGGSAHWVFHGGTNYLDQSGNVLIVIGQAEPSVVYSGYEGGTYDGNSHTRTVTVSGVAGEGALYATSLTRTNAGSHSQEWSYSDNPNYEAVEGLLAFDIAKATATIVVNGYSDVYDGNPHGATGAATGALGEPLAGLDLGGTFSDVPGGNAFWTYTDQTGNYNDAQGSVAIAISQAGTTTVVIATDGVYDGLPHPASASVTGPGGLSQTLTVTYEGKSGTTYGPTTVPPTDAGNYRASAAYAGDNNHLASTAQDDFLIAPKTLEATGDTQNNINISKAKVLTFELANVIGILFGDGTVADLFNGAAFHLRVNGIDYSVTATASVTNNGTVSISWQMTQELYDALHAALNGGTPSDKTIVDFFVSGQSNDGNYILTEDVFARIFEKGTVKFE